MEGLPLAKRPFIIQFCTLKMKPKNGSHLASMYDNIYYEGIFIDEKIDTGAMILQEAIAIQPKENAGQLHDKLMHLGAKLVIETVKLIAAGKVTTTPQSDIKDLKTAYKLDKENCRINWTADAEAISNLIRGLNPYPAAWSLLYTNGEELNVKIYDVKFIKENQ